MFATWILCLFLVLIAPYLLIEASVLRTRKCAQLGAPRGYRSELARSSQTAWDYAQKLCSMRYMLGGIVMAIAALAILFALPIETISSLYLFTLVVVLFEVVTVLCLMASVESSLRKHLSARQVAGLFLTPFSKQQQGVSFDRKHPVVV